eukprot:UN10929
MATQVELNASRSASSEDEQSQQSSSDDNCCKKCCNKITILPHSWLGKVSLGLIIFFVVCVGIFIIFIATGQRGGQEFFSNLYLAIPGVCAGIGAVLAFFTALISIIFYKDYSILLFVTTIIGAIVFIWILMEIAGPH